MPIFRKPLIFVFVVAGFLGAQFSFSKEKIAIEVIASRDEATGAIILKGPDCKTLAHQVDAIREWNKKIDEVHDSKPACTCEKKLGCQIDITQIVPDMVKKTEGVSAAYYGPNCWNAALVSGKLIPELRYTGDGEIAFWLGSPLCHERSSAEEAKPGDIVRIRDRRLGKEHHSFVYLTDQLDYSKHNPTPQEFYTFNTPADEFGISDEASCHGVGGKENSTCSLYATYYDCMTMDRYLSSRASSLSEEFRQANLNVCNFETQLSEIVIHGPEQKESNKIPGPLSKVIINAFTNTAAVLESYVQDELKKPHSPDELFLWKSLLVRVDSAKTQVKQTSW